MKKRIIEGFQITVIFSMMGTILALATGIVYTAITGAIAPWLQWIAPLCVNYW